MLSEKDLIGVWRLISSLNVDEDGAISEGPLGPDPEGLLIYDAHGYMSVSMMRGETGLSADAHSGVAGSGPRRPPTTYMGYSGTWRLVGEAVVHEVEVSSHRHMVNTKQLREAVLDGDRLTLRAQTLLGGQSVRRVLSWRRT